MRLVSQRAALAGAAALVFLSIIFIALRSGWRADSRPAPQAAKGTVIPADFTGSLPRRQGPAGYISSPSCQECHAKQYESWHQSYHRTMTQVMTTNSVVADFDARLEFMGERFTLERRANEFWVRIDDLDELAQAEASRQPPPDPLRIRMGLVTGSHHMQVFWLPTGHGNMQIGFPFTWLIEDQRWVPRNDAFIRDPNALPAREVWNLTCIRCHTTAGQPRPDPERDMFDTQIGDLGISCEACHGPAERHVQHERAVALRRSNSPASPPERASSPESAIVHPESLDHVRASQICGSCHSIKWFDETEGWKDHGFRFRPGDDLEQTTPVVRPTRLESQPWLKGVLERNPALLDDFFWSDGMIRVAGREFNGLLESPCFQRGKMSCLSCHSMHQSDPNDQLARGMDGNRACLQCHTTMRDRIAEHTRHPAESSGSLCYNCHMPHTAYALLKSIRSHQIDSPNVETTLKTGRPNACNLCHLDQSLAWTARYLDEWFGQPKPDLDPDQQSIAASLLWLLTGDAGQRALAAWTLGWDPARRASGDSWQAPHLAQLLADPYSAVRYIAHRSLRQLPGFAGLAYDFVAPPEARDAARDQALGLWPGAPGAGAETAARLLLKPDGTLDSAAVARLLSQRNNRSMRLRE